MSNIVLRAITGTLFVSLMVASTQLPWLFDIICVVFPALCVWELCRMFGYNIWVSIISVVGLFGIIAVRLGYIEQISNYLFTPFIFVFLVVGTASKQKGIKISSITIVGIVYITLSFLFYNNLVHISIDNLKYESIICFDNTYILCMLIFIWINDSFAYLIGRRIGKTPLAPRISPKKTIEGTLGGLVCTILAAIALKYIYTIPDGNWFYVWALLVSISATVGDLIESKVKRIAGVKDSGNLLPGHGGFLDRLDAMLFCSIVSFLFFKFVPLF
ncbi:MAG: phosphatidate cytidylyltransferase [Bacteroidota bacterium]|nr:phosphatidate cytidylyltransferase [Bacteroidota bacterium]